MRSTEHSRAGKMDQPWRIQMFGGLRAERGERVVTRFSWQKVGALLGYLAYHRRRSHPREVLIEVLWPGTDPRTGRGNFRWSLHSLRRQLEPPGVLSGSVIQSDRSSVQLNPDTVQTDVADFEAALQAAGVAGTDAERVQHLMRAVDLYQGDLLSGYYQDWILVEQRRLADLYSHAVRRLTADLQRLGEPAQAIGYARRAASIDPLNESAQCDLMRLLASVGRSEAALRQYEELKQVLKDELDVAPSSAAAELARKIKVLAAEGASATSVSLAEADTSQTVPGMILRGAVTFLLTQIADTAALKEKHSEAFDQAVEIHEATLKALFEQHGGNVIRQSPDSFTAAFERATDALAAAVAGQQALSRASWPEMLDTPRVRMTLDTREVRLRDDEPSGSLFRRSMALLLAAHGGQILCSEATAGLIRQTLTEGVGLKELGIYRLANIAMAERLFAVDYPGMEPAEVPPPNATPAYTSNLPLQLTRFFGREDELAWLEENLLNEETHIVTLTGPGGSGKTRLAVEAARHLLEPLREAVWFVALQDLADPRNIPGRIVDALRLQRCAIEEPLDQAVEALSQQPSLLVLDNFEHLVEEGAPLVRTLVEKIPTLTCLVTSRQPLGLTGEHEFLVAPLPVPRGEESPESVAQFASVELFVDRAQAVKPDFQVSKRNARAISEICDRLDGVPLALELAAARVQTLTPKQMLDQLEHRLDFLISRKRDVVDRHRTLRASVEWSYRLLSSELQRFFARLSVFRGGWTVEAAQSICEEAQAADHLAVLRASSIVMAEEPPGETETIRFRMLETLREFATEQLSAEDAAALRRRHAEWYLEFISDVAPKLAEPDQEKSLALVDTEHDNLRAALDWCKSPNGEVDVGLKLIKKMTPFWDIRSHYSEARMYCLELLAMQKPPKPSVARADTLNVSGVFAFFQGDFPEARAFYEEALSIQRTLDDKPRIAATLHTNRAII